MKRQAKPINPKRPALRRMRADLTRALAAFLKAQASDIAAQVIELRAKLGKADTPKRGTPAAEAATAADGIVGRLEFKDWSVLVGDLDAILASIAKDGATEAFASIGFETVAGKAAEITASQAVHYGEQRAAELVGMRVTATGGVIQNPNAKWRITESTRDFLRGFITSAIEDGASNDELAAAIRDSYAFSRERAMAIARTETNMASNRGALDAYKASGVVETKEWLTAEDDRVSEDCEANGEAGAIALADAFPSGALAPPDHPNCRCTLLPGVNWEKVGAIPDLSTTEETS